jgi:hypothetical protein
MLERENIYVISISWAMYNGLEINLQKCISFTYYLLGESLQNCTPDL